MKFGQFNDEKKEYVIHTPKTPWPWINYLGTDTFFSLTSNTCGGYSFYKDARFRRLTRYQYNNSNLDTNGKYFYINDNGTVWNPGWKPSKTELDAYECRHGLGYTKIRGEKNGVMAEVLSFVPLNYTGEVQKVTLKNESEQVKTLKLFSYVEFCLYNAVDDSTNFQRTYSIGRAEKMDQSIVHFTDYKDRRNHFAFHYTNAEISGYDCDRESFTGVHCGLDEPEVVTRGKSNNSRAFGWNPIASQQINVELKPGEEKEFVFILGYVENPEQEKWDGNEGNINLRRMHNMVNAYNTVEKIDEGLSALARFWDHLLANIKVQTGNEHVDRSVNIWNQYQCMVTFNMSRSASYFESGIGRGMGFRDSNQDLLGFVHQVPERARERLIDIASTQLPDGGAYHQYQPLTKRGNNEVGSNFNDDPLWLICAVVAYVRETGDFGLLEEQVPFDNDENNKASMFEHLNRAFKHVVNNLGPHKLPLIGRADWNDCMNLNIFNTDPDMSFQTGTLKKDCKTAESMMIAGAFMLYGKEFVELCEFTGRNKLAAEAAQHLDNMATAIDNSGWDGEWFLRAYDSDGNKVGSKDNNEGKIFIESQGFCGMAGIGLNDGRLEKALNSVKTHLDTPYGVVLCNPAFTRYEIGYGEISTFIPGYKENAGIFCHNNPWIMIAETVLGRAEEAFEYYMKICPSNLESISEIHRTEPYVYSQMVGGKDAYKPGEAKNSWLTGTAAWNFVAITQYILGIRPMFGGLLIEPCIPADWKEYSVSRVFRGATYKITVKNPEGVQKGVKKVIVNGNKIDSNILPIFEHDSVNQVEVIMGK